MGRKKKEENKDEVVVLEKIEKPKSSNGVSEVFYYLLGLVIGIVLIFATEELLSTINSIKNFLRTLNNNCSFRRIFSHSTSL